MKVARMGFLLWYYTRGFLGLLTIVGNFLWFVWEFFSVRELVATLFFPWHRDVAHKYWQGFDPGKLLWLFAENIISRLIGAMVRLVTIALGVIVWGVAFVFGALAMMCWIFLPILFVIFAWGVSRSDFLFIAGAGMATCVGFLFVALGAYSRERRESSGRDRFWKKYWFRRVLTRVGVDPRELHDLRDAEDVSEFLSSRHIDQKDFEKALSWELLLEEDRENRSAFWRKENLQKISPIARKWRFGFTPHLDQFGFDMLSLGGFEDIRVCAHPRELESMKMTLMRPEQNSVLLVAPPGTGKDSLIVYLAKQMAMRTSGVSAPGQRLVKIDLDRVFSASAQSGNAIALIQNLFLEAIGAGNVTLVVEGLDTYVGEEATRMSRPDMSSVLTRFLESPGFRLIATTTTRGFHATLERNEGVLKYMEVIELEPINEDTAVDVLLDAFDGFENKHIVFTLDALRAVVRHSARFHPEVPLPERALDVAKEAIVFWRQHPESDHMTRRTIDAFVSFKTGIPLGDIEVSEQEKLLRLEQILAKRVIGQVEATKQVAQAMKRARAGLGSETKPIGSFLFLGPTGVGKTELAKTLAKAYFGKQGSLVRLDMSEYQSADAISRLLGDRHDNTPGYLATLVRDTPYGVLLLDEIEKADSGVLDIFLQVLDEGFATDAFGDKILFTNMIIIATSNAGASIIRRRTQEGMASEDIKRQIIEYVTDTNMFRPEFLNRFDGIIYFRPIDEKDMVRIAKILLEESVLGIQKSRGIKVVFHEGVYDRVVANGYDPQFGARSIRRYIADAVESIIAERVIRENPDRGETIVIRAEDVV